MMPSMSRRFFCRFFPRTRVFFCSIFFFSLLGCWFAVSASAQTSPDIRAEDLRLHVSVLASDAMDGRLTGTAGELAATACVAAVFHTFGLKPAGDDGTF